MIDHHLHIDDDSTDATLDALVQELTAYMTATMLDMTKLDASSPNMRLDYATLQNTSDLLRVLISDLNAIRGD